MKNILHDSFTTTYMKRIAGDFAAQGFILAIDEGGYFRVCIQSGGCNVPLAFVRRFSAVNDAENWLRGFECARARFEQREGTD